MDQFGTWGWRWRNSRTVRADARPSKTLKLRGLPLPTELLFGIRYALHGPGGKAVSNTLGRTLGKLRAHRAVGSGILLVLLSTAPGWPQTPETAPAETIQKTEQGQARQGSQAPQKDLTTASIEDLMNIQVTSASKKEQKLSKVAAGVFVMTQEDIRRSGATSIPELLRMVPGMDVAEINGSTWAIGARGFNQQYESKLLVLVDGRSVYSPTFAGVFWDTLDLPLFDIERIEVIRGPGGTIWGANAVSGVISIFTKKAAETKGTIVEGGRKCRAGIWNRAVRRSRRQRHRLSSLCELLQSRPPARPEWPEWSRRLAQAARRVSDGQHVVCERFANGRRRHPHGTGRRIGIRAACGYGSGIHCRRRGNQPRRRVLRIHLEPYLFRDFEFQLAVLLFAAQTRRSAEPGAPEYLRSGLPSPVRLGSPARHRLGIGLRRYGRPHWRKLDGGDESSRSRSATLCLIYSRRNCIGSRAAFLDGRHKTGTQRLHGL